MVVSISEDAEEYYSVRALTSLSHVLYSSLCSGACRVACADGGMSRFGPLEKENPVQMFPSKQFCCAT